ncbi:hypothetical protein VH571_09585 [Frondihabitans sp. 4ASC-45]|uniref:hypothetical protein n=1 Tax=Frondihabitans sp. 4ASC-45 TaxID=3111636 RepID=UPI003C222580
MHHPVIPIVQAITGQRAGPFTLTYLDEPTKRRTRTSAAGTTLVLRNTGRHTVRDVHVRPLLHTAAVATAGRLRKQGALGVCSGVDVVEFIAGKELLVRWVDHTGEERSVWMRIPPLPRRFVIPAPSGVVRRA